MLIAEMAAYYKTKNMSLYEALMDIYKKYGYYFEKTVSFTMPGKDGMEKMAELLCNLRVNPPKSVNGYDIITTTDYKEQTVKNADGSQNALKGLPKADVLKYNLSDEKSYFIVRPSGTEPKIKIYLASIGESFDEASSTVENMLDDIKNQLGL